MLNIKWEYWIDIKKKFKEFKFTNEIIKCFMEDKKEIYKILSIFKFMMYFVELKEEQDILNWHNFINYIIYLSRNHESCDFKLLHL